MARVPHRPGFCINCGNQTAIRTPTGLLAGILPGVSIVWLKLENDAGKVHRVGSLMLCESCDHTKVDCDDVKNNLCDTPRSGVTHEDEIWSAFPKKSIELIEKRPPASFK